MKETSPTPHAVFVYGTLKSDQCRSDNWPHPPLSIEPAVVPGCLYDLGPYPGMIHGDEQVCGEVWSFESDFMPETLRILDGIEDFQGKPSDEYVREVIECSLLCSSQVVPAFTYIYAQLKRLTPERKIAPSDDDALCRWPQ